MVRVHFTGVQPTNSAWGESDPFIFSMGFMVDFGAAVFGEQSQPIRSSLDLYGRTWAMRDEPTDTREVSRSNFVAKKMRVATTALFEMLAFLCLDPKTILKRLTRV